VADGKGRRFESTWVALAHFLTLQPSSRPRQARKLELTTPRPKYIERFGEAFVNEMNAFAECCLDDKRESDRTHRTRTRTPPVPVQLASAAVGRLTL
jgi:hypothetical protein